jgi:hypothetical protein
MQSTPCLGFVCCQKRAGGGTANGWFHIETEVEATVNNLCELDVDKVLDLVTAIHVFVGPRDPPNLFDVLRPPNRWD